jgi:hypothetical protein
MMQKTTTLECKREVVQLSQIRVKRIAHTARELDISD